MPTKRLFVPPQAVKLLLKGATPADLVKAGIETHYGAKVSPRTARRWRQHFEENIAESYKIVGVDWAAPGDKSRSTITPVKLPKVIQQRLVSDPQTGEVMRDVDPQTGRRALAASLIQMLEDEDEENEEEVPTPEEAAAVQAELEKAVAERQRKAEQQAEAFAAANQARYSPPPPTPPHGGDHYDELMEITERLQDIAEAEDPTITRIERRFETDKPIVILLAGCFHLGGRWTCHKLIRDKVSQLLALDGVYIGLMGDEIDGFLPGFRSMASVEDQPLSPKYQIVFFDAFLQKIKDRCLFGTWSQHGAIWFEHRTGRNPLKERYIDCKVPYFDGQGCLSLWVGHNGNSQLYHLIVSHVFPGNSKDNPNHSQVRALKDRYPHADVLAQADKHNYSVQERSIYDQEAEIGLRPSNYVHLVQVGTAKTGSDRYTIRAWESGEGEWPFVGFWPDRHEVRVSRHIDEVKHWLRGKETTNGSE